MHSKTLTIAALTAFSGFVLAACTPYDTGLGENVKRNMAMHVINPDPQYSGVSMEGSSGDHAAAATERYRKGTVKEPQTIRTTSAIGGGGSGSSGGSGGSR